MLKRSFDLAASLAGLLLLALPMAAIALWVRLDERPQRWSVLVGEMSLVGPRPALFNQDDLMELRRQAGVDHLRPGITGWAQVNGRDELPLPQKVAFERQYLERQSFLFDLRIILLTLVRGQQGVAH